MRTVVKCPYCGFAKNFIDVKYPSTRKLITCDLEEGGCDQEFVAEGHLEVTVTTRKVEGGKQV